MKILIIYDSIYGNTEKIAQAIRDGLEHEVIMLHVKDAHISDVKTCDFLLVGSPTHGGRPMPSISTFLQKIPSGSLINVPVSAFDTRFAPEEHGIGLRVIMSILQFAGPKIARILMAKGGSFLSEPMGFIVEDKKGPLCEGEIERAKAWAKSIQRRI